MAPYDKYLYSQAFSHQDFPDPSIRFPNHQKWPITSIDNYETYSYYIPYKPSPEKDLPIIFYIHGNGDPKWRLVMLDDLQNGFAAHSYFPCYRGHYNDPKKPKLNENSISKDIYASFFVLKHKIPNLKIIIYGLSLGGGLSTRFLRDLIRNGESKCVIGLVLDNVFISLPKLIYDMKKIHQQVIEEKIGIISSKLVLWIPKWVLSLFLWCADDVYSNERNLKMIYGNETNEWICPVMVIGSTKDKVIPVEHSKVVFDICKQNSNLGECRKFYIEFDCDHGCAQDDPNYVETMSIFFKSLTFN
jgi:pimeloyl-ACP methyl ester carboxylesterase